MVTQPKYPTVNRSFSKAPLKLFFLSLIFFMRLDFKFLCTFIFSQEASLAGKIQILWLHPLDWLSQSGYLSLKHFLDSVLPSSFSRWSEVFWACSHCLVCFCCSVSLLSPVLSRLTRLARTRIVACLPACLCVFMSCSCTTTSTTTTSTSTTTSLSPPHLKAMRNPGA